MKKIYEGGSEAEDIIFSTAVEVPLLWEWDDEISEIDLSIELNLTDIEIIEEHLDLNLWEDSDGEEQKEIESIRKTIDEPYL